LRVAATAVAGIALAGSAAFHLIGQPSAPGRGAHAVIRERHTPRSALPGALPATAPIARHRVKRAGISLRTAAAHPPNAHSRRTHATTTKHARAVTIAVEPAVAGQGGGPPAPATPAEGVRAPAWAPARAAIAPADARPADAAPAVSTPAATTKAVTTPAITVPSVSLPAVTTPAITVPSVSLPAVTTPVVSLPAVSTPAVTLPAVTVPAVTTPPVSLPGASSAKAGTPVATVPVVTVPGISIPALPTSR
jgi:hypothetical protein